MVGATPSQSGRDPMKNAHLGADQKRVAKVGKRPEAERVWRALVINGLGQRPAAEQAGVRRATVRKYFDKWVALGWCVKKKGGGLRPTDRAPKDLREGWASTPQGSPLHPHAPYVRAVGRPSRIHRGKLTADLDRSVDLSGDRDQWWESSKPGPNGVVYSLYVVPCKTDNGMVGVPVQLIQPKRQDRPIKVVIQSANVMADEADILDLGRAGVLAWVRDAMSTMLNSWLGPEADKLGPLRWTGLDKEDLEVAQEAMRGAKVQGDVQRDFVAVDRSDRYKPKEWAKEEEQTLAAFIRLRQVERDVEQLLGGQERITSILERVVPSITDQMDGLAAITEALHQKVNK